VEVEGWMMGMRTFTGALLCEGLGVEFVNGFREVVVFLDADGGDVDFSGISLAMSRDFLRVFAAASTLMSMFSLKRFRLSLKHLLYASHARALGSSDNVSRHL
jgi:hypothetical protein